MKVWQKIEKNYHYILIVLLMVAMVSVSGASKVTASYSTQTRGTSSVKVAAFGATVTPINLDEASKNMVITDANKANGIELPFRVTVNSEVSCYLDMVVLYDTTPGGIDMILCGPSDCGFPPQIYLEGDRHIEFLGSQAPEDAAVDFFFPASTQPITRDYVIKFKESKSGITLYQDHKNIQVYVRLVQAD